MAKLVKGLVRLFFFFFGGGFLRSFVHGVAFTTDSKDFVEALEYSH